MTKKTGGDSVMDLNLALWRMGFEAQSVIAMRAMGAAGFWNSSTSENQLMVREKQVAFAKGTANATRALMRGESPAAIMLEAVKPMKDKTGSNARRLTKRGPRIPGLVG
ncbi:MAG: antifreeze protein [Pseudomonadota bacterium]